MPKIFEKNGFQFFLYTNEHEPVHVHVRYAGGEAVFVIGRSVRLRSSQGLKVQELARAEKLAEENKPLIVLKWDEHVRNRSR